MARNYQLETKSSYMIIFADTSSDQTKIAFIENGSFVEEITFESRGMQTELLIKRLDEMLCKRNITKNDIQIFVVVSGPGSYTGLRVGISTFNALAFALNIPIIGVSSEATIDQMSSAVSKVKILSFGGPVSPVYPHPPKITISTRP